jgi:uncharacterized membrane protein
MNNFEQSIKDAQDTHQPSPDFINRTMQQISEQQPKARKRWTIKLWIPALAGGLAIIAVIFFAFPSPATAPKAPVIHVANTSTVPIAAGTDNASLESDLNSVQGSMSQENTDQNSANTAINDNLYEISVPTS